MDILIVDDDPLVCESLRSIVEAEGCHRVTAFASDLASAVTAVEQETVSLALVDIRLSRNCSGYGVAAELSRRGIVCIFVTATVPPFPMPEFALGCISKPFTVHAVRHALENVEALLAGAAESDGAVAGFEIY